MSKQSALASDGAPTGDVIEPTLRQEAQRTLGHSAIMIPFRAFAMGVQLFISLFLARALGAEGFGQWGLMLALSQWGYTFFLYWNTSGLTRYGREEYLISGHVRETFGSRSVLFGISLVVLTLVAAGGAGHYARMIGMPVGVIALIYLYTLAFALSETVQYILPALGRSDLTSGLLALERSLSLAGLAWLYRYGVLNPVNTLVAVTLPAILMGTIVLVCYRRRLFPLHWNRNHFRRYWKFCRPVLVIAPAGGIVGWVDLFVINHYSTLGNVGRYFLAYQFVNAVAQMSFVITIVTGPFAVLLVLKKRADLCDLYANRLQWISWLGGTAAAIAVTPIAWLVFHWITGEEAESVRFIWLLLLPGSIATFMTSSLSSFYMAHEDTVTPAYIAAGGMFINLILDFTLVPRIGPMGAGIATTSAAFFNYYFLMMMLKRFGVTTRGLWARSAMCLLPAILVYVLSVLPLLHAGMILMVLALVIGLATAYMIQSLMQRRFEWTM